VKFEFTPRITGHTDIIESTTVTGTGVNQMNYPSDVRKMPNGNYLVVEMNSSRERDSTGKIPKTTNVATPPAPAVRHHGRAPVAGRRHHFRDEHVPG